MMNLLRFIIVVVQLLCFFDQVSFHVCSNFTRCVVYSILLIIYHLILIKATNCLSIQRKSAEQQDFPPLTTLVTFPEGDAYVVSILKPTHLSHFKVKRRKFKRFRTTHEEAINAVSQHQFDANNNDTNNNQNKFRFCLKQLKLAKWRRRHARYGIWRCRIKFSVFGPNEIVIPIEIKSMDNISNEHAPNKRVDRIDKVNESITFDGPESSYARSKNDAYYRSQVAVGDPVRSKRTKRIRRTIAYHPAEFMTVMPLLNEQQTVFR